MKGRKIKFSSKISITQSVCVARKGVFTFYFEVASLVWI